MLEDFQFLLKRLLDSSFLRSVQSPEVGNCVVVWDAYLAPGADPYQPIISARESGVMNPFQPPCSTHFTCTSCFGNSLPIECSSDGQFPFPGLTRTFRLVFLKVCWLQDICKNYPVKVFVITTQVTQDKIEYFFSIHVDLVEKSVSS